MAEPAKVPDGEALPDLDRAVDDMLAEFNGDARGALTALLKAHNELVRRMAMTVPVVSYGFSRGWHHHGDQRR